MCAERVPGAAGVDLAVTVGGAPTAPPLVLLHALGETAESWAHLAPLFQQRYRTYTFDLRGHGASDWPGVYSTDLMRDDVIAALDALGVDRFSLVGHSLGGAVALRIAEQEGPRVSQLVIEDVVPPYPREARDVPERPEVELPFDWAVLEVIYGELTDPDMREWPALESITAPTLVIGGGAASHIPGELIEKMAGLIADCTVATVDAGHFVHVEAPEQFARIVLDWLAG